MGGVFMKKAVLLIAIFLLMFAATAQADVIDLVKTSAAEGYKTFTIPGYDEREVRSWTYQQGGFTLDIFYSDGHDLRWSGNKMRVELTGHRFLTFALSPAQEIEKLYYESEGNNDTFRVYDDNGWSVLTNMHDHQGGGSYLDLAGYSNILYIEFHGGQNSNVFFMSGLEIDNDIPTPTPLPATVWLLGSGFAGLTALRKKKLG